MEQLKQQLQAAGILYKENEPLSAHCTFRIGGPADLFVMPRMKISFVRPFSSANRRRSAITCWAMAATSCLRMRAFEEQSLMFLPKQREWDCRFIKMPTAIIFRHRQV